MPDAADGENAPPQAQRTKVRGQYSLASQKEKKSDAAWFLVTLEAAVAYARGHEIGAKSVL